jgi:hypothetical protein
MSDSPFALAIQELKSTQPNELVAQLNKVFLRITEFTADEAVAAYQTLLFIEETLQGGTGVTFVNRLKEATLVQMTRIHRESVGVLSVSQQVGQIIRFKRVTGRDQL